MTRRFLVVLACSLTLTGCGLTEDFDGIAACDESQILVDGECVCAVRIERDGGPFLRPGDDGECTGRLERVGIVGNPTLPVSFVATLEIDGTLFVGLVQESTLEVEFQLYRVTETGGVTEFVEQGPKQRFVRPAVPAFSISQSAVAGVELYADGANPLVLLVLHDLRLAVIDYAAPNSPEIYELTQEDIVPYRFRNMAACDAQRPCTGTDVCGEVLMVGRCLPACSGPADCSAGYACEPVEPGMAMACNPVIEYPTLALNTLDGYQDSNGMFAVFGGAVSQGFEGGSVAGWGKLERVPDGGFRVVFDYELLPDQLPPNSEGGRIEASGTGFVDFGAVPGLPNVFVGTGLNAVFQVHISEEFLPGCNFFAPCFTWGDIENAVYQFEFSTVSNPPTLSATRAQPIDVDTQLPTVFEQASTFVSEQLGFEVTDRSRFVLTGLATAVSGQRAVSVFIPAYNSCIADDAFGPCDFTEIDDPALKAEVASPLYFPFVIAQYDRSQGSMELVDVQVLEQTALGAVKPLIASSIDLDADINLFAAITYDTEQENSILALLDATTGTPETLFEYQLESLAEVPTKPPTLVVQDEFIFVVVEAGVLVTRLGVAE